MSCDCVSTELNRILEVDQKTEEPQEQFQTVVAVHNASNGYAVESVNVQAYVTVPSEGSTVPVPQPILVGRSTTNHLGQAVINWDDAALTRDVIDLVNRNMACICVRAFHQSGREYTFTQVTRGAGLSTRRVLHITVPRVTVPSDVWQILSKRAQQAQIRQIHHLVERLMLVPAKQSIAPEWDVELRHAVLDALGTAFLDPRNILSAQFALPSWQVLSTEEGLEAYRRRAASALSKQEVKEAFDRMLAKLAKFPSMSQVDWVFDYEMLGGASVGGAVTKYEAAYEVAGGIAADQVYVFEDQSLLNYRNYLRAVFAGAPESSTYANCVKQLRDRFHQDFTTTETTSKSANALLNAILVEILTAPAGATYGFGKAAASIDPQNQRTDVEYREYLLSLTGLSRDEMQRRYRLDLDLPADAVSSRVQLNIDTLQRFFRDGFQSQADPFPIIPAKALGQAPYFLYYEEWLQLNGAFFGENYYKIRETIDGGLSENDRKYIATMAANPANNGFVRYVNYILRLEDKLAEAQNKTDVLQYKQALEIYRETYKIAEEALRSTIKKVGSEWLLFNDNNQSASNVFTKINAQLQDLLKAKVQSLNDLEGPHYGGNPATFMNKYKTTWWHRPSGNSYLKFIEEVQNDYPQHMLTVAHAYLYVIPVCMGDTYMAMGDYATAEYCYRLATGLSTGRADQRDGAGYPAYDGYGINGSTNVQLTAVGNIFPQGGLPYTTDVSGDTQSPRYAFTTPFSSAFHVELASLVVPKYTHTMEKAYFRIKHANALLEWADALYRANDEASMGRARELYKAVILLHGEKPDIAPLWEFANWPIFYYLNHKTNPAIASQLSRARLMLYQLDNGLNYFGASGAHVPALRYRPLKEAADRFASAAKAAETDFITSLSKVEEALKDGLLTANLLKKAGLHAKIAGEQRALAQYQVTLVDRQVSQIKSAIKAKEAEIGNHDDFGEQLVDWCKGFAEVLTDLPASMTKGMSFDAAATGFGLSSGSAGSFSSGGWMGMGAGATAAGAFGLFIYAGVTAMVNTGDAQNQRVADLKALRDKALPLALEQKSMKEREVKIAEMQRDIAAADAELVWQLTHFQATRTLSTEFWSNIASAMKRILRRYLELAARYAWMAERALAYEQDRQVGVVRFDYLQPKSYGTTGADLLQLDLAELEALRLSGVRQSVPVKHTFSMAFDFPLQFAQLKKTGKCSFRTPEQHFRDAYPGVYGYRVRAISVAVQTTKPVGAIRGLLTNNGVSVISRIDGTSHTSARFPEGFPLSEFRIEKDMAVYKLTEDTLLNFEGSGVETFWTLEFPLSANPAGLDPVADILVTFDLTAAYSAELHQKQLAEAPSKVNRNVVVSVRTQCPTAIDELAGNGSQTVSMSLDLKSVKLPKSETNRKVKNLFLTVASPEPLSFNASLASQSTALTIPVTQNVAISNAPPIGNGNPAAPLNGFIGQSVDQTFTVTINKSANPGVDFSGVVDVVLGINYEADAVTV